MQLTSCPLKSWWFSFSTAFWRSAAVSYSTNLTVLATASALLLRKLTQCHRAHVQLRSRQHPVRIGGRNLSSPVNARLGGVHSRTQKTRSTRNKAFPDRGCMALTGKTRNPRIGVSHLPAGFHGKIGNPHPKGSTTGTRSGALVRNKVLVTAGSAGELNDETLAHKVRSVYQG